MKNKSAEKIKLTSYDDLFGTKDNSVEGIYTTVALASFTRLKITLSRYWTMKKCRKPWKV